MTTQYYSGPTYGGRFISFLLALMLGAIAFAVFIRHATTGTAGRVVTLITGRAGSTELSVPTVVDAIHRMGRVQTTVYTLDTVVEGKASAATRRAPEGERELLVVHGQSSAGMDLAQVKPEDVQIDAGGHGVHVTLPASQLFSTTLDDQSTRAYSRGGGGLAAAQQELAPDVRANALETMQKTARADGILDAASKNARSLVSVQLYGLGFKQVEVH